jgi:predicted transcriptional regulator
MLTDQQLAILREIDNSVAFDGDARDEVNKLVIEGYVEKDGDLYQLTPKGEKALLDNGARIDEL